jgi:hypothetical protein
VNYFLEKYTDLVDDLSGRDVYALENLRLIPNTRMQNRVVFLGSQITAGWDLKKYFGEYDIINRGISGQRLAGYLLRFQPDVVELKPKTVIIEFSSFNFRPENNLKELKDYLSSMVAISLANGIEPILTTIVPVRSDFDEDYSESYNVQDSLIEFNHWLTDYCRKNEIKYVDFFRTVADSDGFLTPENSNGQIILSSAGYNKISSATMELLRQSVIIGNPSIKE